MTWSNRLRLLGGFIFVLVIVASATFLLNQRESQATSSSASIESKSYTVGSDYPGSVVREYVEEGEEVQAGERLLTLQSAKLLRDIQGEAGAPESAAYTVTDDGTLTLIATESGVVSNLFAGVGGFVDAGEALATVDRADSLHVVAHFLLEPQDFARVENGAFVEVVLPDRSRVRGAVTDIRVETVRGKADVKIEVQSDEFVRSEPDGFTAPGTPVTAMLQLRDDGPLAGLRNSVLELLDRIGL